MIVTHDDVMKVQEEYKKNYPPFQPYKLNDQEIMSLGNKYYNLITTQNGPDTDDYVMPEVNKITKHLTTYKDKRALLIGVGTGREVKAALDLGVDADGITLGSRNVEFGRRYLGLGDRLKEAALEILPADKETYDIVAGFQIFEHCMSPLLFLLEIGRILKMGGKVLLEWPPAADHTGEENPHHQICYTPGQARALLLKAGFRNVELYYDDTMTTIPESDYWNGDQKRYIVVVGTKVPPEQDYIRRAWNG